MRILQVYHDKRSKKAHSKDGWAWRVIEKSKKKKGRMNVLYRASGYDYRHVAERMAHRHNNSLKVPLEFEVIYT